MRQMPCHVCRGVTGHREVLLAEIDMNPVFRAINILVDAHRVARAIQGGRFACSKCGHLRFGTKECADSDC